MPQAAFGCRARIDGALPASTTRTYGAGRIGQLRKRLAPTTRRPAWQSGFEPQTRICSGLLCMLACFRHRVLAVSPEVENCRLADSGFSSKPFCASSGIEVPEYILGRLAELVAKRLGAVFNGS